MDLFILIITIILLAEVTILVIKSTKPLTTNARRKVLVDTSALMDGRILPVVQTGFVTDELIIPRSVIRELQLLADGKEPDKRARARYGLDVVNELERVVHIETTIYQDDLDHTPVDERLIQLAHKSHAAIMTCDFNLNKVATAENIDVLNINDLALVLRNEYLPGDTFRLRITTKGSNPKQGVGHLPDGTMVVVDNASDKVDHEVDIEFVRFLQTSAGRMMFAKLKAPSKSSKKSPNRSRRRKSKSA